MSKDSDFDVFISYCRKDKEEVLKIKTYLEAYKIKVWLDLEKIQDGELRSKALSDEIRRCKVSHQSDRH